MKKLIDSTLDHRVLNDVLPVVPTSENRGPPGWPAGSCMTTDPPPAPPVPTSGAVMLAAAASGRSACGRHAAGGNSRIGMPGQHAPGRPVELGLKAPGRSAGR
ncbi:6-carboxytetrahydropterin synthase [Streptomyces viridifaciens]|uniref:6-carboxytetrahydropterin synthase n=1 Tax=Kitasatospora aureofaciens TaxID=1894 RepID=UPI001E3B889B|nr:6-carboxytetrahydropterin synthase [Kitasatospora aureofaciens]UKZ10066.1 6-carboxytetrahydropterin synthase [Streptomyces viridifaciens]